MVLLIRFLSSLCYTFLAAWKIYDLFKAGSYGLGCLGVSVMLVATSLAFAATFKEGL